METDKKPVGWSERYKIVTDDKGIENIKKWIADGRGIKVWVNHDLGSRCGHQMFTPGDGEKPHWAYFEVETVPDLTRIDFFKTEVRYDPAPSKLTADQKRALVG